MSARPHQPLDLAVVGNCEICALIDYQGRVVWMCLPRPDGDPVFSALLTREQGDAPRGVFAVDLQDLDEAEQRYLRNTAIVETVLRDSHGAAVKITDFAPRFNSRGRVFRPMMLIRLIEPLAGRPLLRLRLHPTAAHGAQTPAVHAGSHHLSFAAEGFSYRVTSDASISSLTEDRTFVLDHPITFLLGPDETIEEAPSGIVRAFLEQTREYWQEWVRTLAIPFDWQEAVIRAAITLKLCTYDDSGAVLAAMTTSIPEAPNSGRTWDYRHCWLRDSYFTVQALNRLGATRTMEGYLHFIDHIVARSPVGALRPVYHLLGEGDLCERVMSGLPGYLGMGPVRIGNEAAEQTQNDVYGAIILAAAQEFFDERLVHPGDEALFHELEALGRRAAEVYEESDSGPWEYRAIRRAHTFTAAISWAGCDRLSQIAARLGLKEAAARWRTQADGMQKRILARAWSEPLQCFMGALDGDHFDATVLLLPELGLLHAKDPRFVATVAAVGRELSAGDLLYRYREADDFGRPATAFTVCAFWYVNALAAVGQVDAARERFDRLLAYRNPLGLLSEDIDTATGTQWGNYPQTYSLVGVINSALRLSRSWEDAL
jgi:GH15 family glucan-1,4-alpha-glucosidase